MTNGEWDEFLSGPKPGADLEAQLEAFVESPAASSLVTPW